MLQVEVDEGEIHFHDISRRHFVLYHEQDCCENVRVYETKGSVDCLIGAEIIEAKESEIPRPYELKDGDNIESETWTLFEFATEKGAVSFLWLGESNGYYSEPVSFSER